MPRFNRRGLLIGGGALAAAGVGTILARPAMQGGLHDPYFARLSKALREANLMRPTLVIDRTRLDANIAAIRASTQAARLPLRVVAKSLPSPGLLDHVMRGLGQNRLMVFSAEMLLQLVPLHPQASFLMGKPLPVSEFIRFTDRSEAKAASDVEWLIDTPLRFQEYASAARARNVSLRANFEIDVGLHRGGFSDAASLADVARKARAGGFAVAGLMGYDPHVPKMPSPGNAYADSQQAYRTAIAALADAGIADSRALTLNGAGSPTFRRHCSGTVANEVSVGSAFVKPGDFDYDDLADLRPAAFIATPVLKRVGDMRLPGVEPLSGLMHWFDRNSERGFFIHGGHWLARPVSPPGLQNSRLFGRSSNQELLTGSHRIELQPGDTVFFRPDQSEAVLLQFGDIAVYDGGAIAETWPTMPISA